MSRNRTTSLRGFALASIIGLSTLSPAQAQEAVSVDELPEGLRQLVLAVATQPKGAPGVAFGSPVAFGAREGDVYFGMNLASGGNQNFIADDLDGGAAFGFGLGDPDRFVGLEIGVNIISTVGTFGEDGSMFAKVHRNLGNNNAVAFGAENFMRWGAAGGGQTSIYAAYSHAFVTRSDPMNPGVLMVNVGLGNRRFTNLGDEDDMGGFVSLGYNITRQFSVIADYTGQVTNLGVSWVPFRTSSFSILLGATNLGGRTTGAFPTGDTELALGVGWSYDWRQKYPRN